MGSYIVPGQAWDRVASQAQWKSEKARGRPERTPTTPRKLVAPQGQAAPKGQVERGTSSESGPPGCSISHRRSHRLLCLFRADPGERLTGENSEGLPEWALAGPDLAGGGWLPRLLHREAQIKNPEGNHGNTLVPLRHWKMLLEAVSSREQRVIIRTAASYGPSSLGPQGGSRPSLSDHLCLGHPTPGFTHHPILRASWANKDRAWPFLWGKWAEITRHLSTTISEKKENVENGFQMTLEIKICELITNLKFI